MRDYAKIAPQFWTGETGKKLRALGPRAQVLAMYLMTSPSANMIGLYYLPLPTLCHETGSPSEGASEALRSLSEASFAHYDPASEHVFVPEMAKYQIGEHLSVRDNRHKAIVRELDAFRKSPFFNDFLQRYRDDFELGDVFGGSFELSPSEAPSKPLRSQKQEQEQEQKQERAPRGKPRATRIPENFGISDGVRAWATGKGINKLDQHLESFIAKAKAKGYEYVDWDSAFQEAIRKDWAGLKNVNGQGGDWVRTEQGIMAKGAEIGIPRQDGESNARYRDRIKARIEELA